mgnify:CR=1 FL=1
MRKINILPKKDGVTKHSIYKRPFLDYAKFLKAISMLAQSNEEGRLRFLYSLFDVNLEGSIEKDEMYNLMMMFLEVFKTYHNKGNDVYKLRK